MQGCYQGSFPLTVAQRGLWFSQKITPGALMNIAEAVEIFGSVHPETFQRALRQVIAEAEQLRVRVFEADGRPQQVPRPVYEGDFPYVDLSHEEDPQAAITNWMTAEWSRPLDLARDPLWSSALLKAGDKRYFWYQRAHHIVNDGYGGGLVARRLAEVYTAYVNGAQPSANQFCTVQAMVEAEARYRNSDRFRRDREYWLQQLAGMPEPVTLSRIQDRRELSSTLRRSVGYFSSAMIAKLTETAKLYGASLPQALIALIAAYYHRFTGADDLVFRMPVSGRLDPALRSSIAVAANIVPIRLSFTPQTTVADLFAQTARVVRQALRHQQYRYEDLRRDLGLVGQNQNIAWLGVNIEPFDYRLDFNGAPGIAHNLSNSGAEDLTIFVYDRGTGADVRFDLDANPALYSATELEDHKRRLIRLVEQAIAGPSRPLKTLDILGDTERQRLLVEWNATAKPLSYTSLPSLVEQWAHKTPDAPAVVFGDAVISYQQLHWRSASYARHLMASGIKPGDIVAVAVPRSEQLLMVLLAIMRTGAAYLPLDLDGPVERMSLVLEDASPAALIAQPQIHQRLAHGHCMRLVPESAETAADHVPPVPDFSSPDRVVYLLYTSGSTGKPKGVEVTHRNLANFLEGMRLELRPTADDRFLAITTLIFDIAALELYLPLTVGACVVMAGSDALRNPPVLARLIQRTGITHMQATPSLWRILFANSKTRLNGVHALVGGEALSSELASRLKNMAQRVTQFYGPTETTVWSTALELNEVGDTPPPIGRHILNTQLYVLDEDQQLVPTGAIGELYIAGEGVARGYLNRPELTATRFVADPFTTGGGRMYRTGDLVRWNHDGVLEFIGRADNQVKINGHRVELGEIESVLLQHSAIAEAAVAVHRDADGSISLHAYLVPSGGRSLDIRSVRSFLSGRLPGHMMPSSLTLLEAMPLTPNGKLDRKALPVPQCTSTNLYVEPATPVEKKLALIWQEVLKAERVGLHDNFFDLGGDSLSAAEFIAHFHASFEMELPMGTLFEAPTIASLASMVERISREGADPLAVVLPLRSPAHSAHRPLFCIHPMAGVSLGFSSLLRHLSPEIPVYGLQSRGLRGGHLPSSIEEIAADYMEQIRRIQPEGPYRLLGRSMGGLIAHSITHLLEQQDSSVELLAMIDSFLFLPSEFGRPLTEAEEVKAALTFMNVHLDEDQAQRTLKELGEFLLHPDNAHSVPLAHQGMMKVTQMVMKNDPEFLENLTAVMLNNLKLARQYRPHNTTANLLYFHATEMLGDLNEIIHRSPSAWLPFVTGKPEVHELACHHEAVLDPQPAAQIGRVLQQRLSSLDSRTTLKIPPLALEEAGENTAAYV